MTTSASSRRSIPHVAPYTPPTAFFLLLWICALLAAAEGYSQTVATGTVTGRISNSAAGNFLNNVRVTVEGTALEAYTNESGDFVLAGVPAGEASVRATAVSLGQRSARVDVVAGQTVRRDFDFQGAASSVSTGDQAIVLEKFAVVEREWSAQAAALQEQRAAANIKNVISFEEFGDLGEGNAGEFLKYVPGVQVIMSPAVPQAVSIRGMPADGTILTVDGVELASDGPASRGAGFTSSNTANIDRIEVTKVPTPDMPANAVGGMINIITKSGFSRRVPQFTYNVFGTLTTLEPLNRLGRELVASGGPDGPTNGAHTRPGFDFTYIRPVSSTLALSVSGGHNVRWEDKDTLSPVWNRVALIQTTSAINAQVAARHRNVISLRADWKPWSGHTVFANFQFTNDDVYSRQHAYNTAYGAGATGGPDFTQGAANGVGSITQVLTYREQLKNTMLFAAGHRFEGRTWRFETSLSRSGARRKTLSATDDHPFFGTVNASIPNLVLRGEGYDRQADGVPPTVTAFNRAGQPVDITDGRLYTLNSVTSPAEPLMTNDLTAFKFNAARNFDLVIPFRLMAGFDFLRNERDLRSFSPGWNFRPTATAAERLVGSYDLINEEYSSMRTFRNGDRVLWVDPLKVYELYKQNPTWFVLNEASAHTSLVNGSRALEETISAGFIRTDFKLLDNRLWIVAGVRYERTDDEGYGALNDLRATYQQDANGNLLRNAAGQPIKVVGTALALAQLQYKERGLHVKKSYGDYYPSLNTSYSFAENFVVRAAYARTIGRPALNLILPSSSIADPTATEVNRVINTTNTGLQPWTANNYDLSLETYSRKGATIAVSVFRKEISQFFLSTRTDATPELLAEMGLPDEYLDYDVISTRNSDEDAAINGLEWSWRQSFRDFGSLPRWARSLQVFVNGTHLRISGPGADNFAGFAPLVLNGGFSYATSRFLLKLNVSRTGRTRDAVVAESATVPAATYNSADVRMVMDGSVEYRLHRNFGLYVSVRNLANEPRPLITHSANAPAYTEPRSYTYYGSLWTFGIKGTF